MSRITKDNDISELQSEKDVLKNAVTNAVGVKDYIKNVFTGEFGRARRKKLAGVVWECFCYSTTNRLCSPYRTLSKNFPHEVLTADKLLDVLEKINSPPAKNLPCQSSQKFRHRWNRIRKRKNLPAL